MECRLRQELDPQGVLVLNITLEEEVRGADMFRSSPALVFAHFWVVYTFLEYSSLGGRFDPKTAIMILFSMTPAPK